MTPSGLLLQPRMSFALLWLTPLSALFSAAFGETQDASKWPTCENRAYREEEVGPGGLRLIGVKESPLGDFPGIPAPLTHEHFFQQLREVWSDDCPRVMVQLGLQPAPGLLMNWSAAALWLHYFNHSGVVMAVDAVDDYLLHFQEGLRSGPLSGVFSGEGRKGATVDLRTVRAAVSTKDQSGKKNRERPVSFDAPGGQRVLAADEVMRACSAGKAGSGSREAPGHPCARILQRMADPKPLEYTAPLATFDAIWARDLSRRHIDFLHVDLGVADMPQLFSKSFVNLFREREVSVLAFRVDALWTKDDLRAVVRWLDAFEYFSLFKFVCAGSSQAGNFKYHGPGGVETGPTTYLPISGTEFDDMIDWDSLPLPQDVLALDLRQPDVFRAVQQGDAECDVEEATEEQEESCVRDGSGQCQAGSTTAAPGRPEGLRVVRSESRALTIEWRAHPEGAVPETYELRVEPGAVRDTLDHDGFELGSYTQVHTIGALQPDTEYSVRLWAAGPGGASEEARVVHRTEREQAAAMDAAYDLAERLHCGMSSAEEVSPAGPPPQGTSFFMDARDPEGCRIRCDDNRQCVAFQVKEGEACWLYRRRPRDGLFAGPRVDLGWWCGVKTQKR